MQSKRRSTNVREKQKRLVQQIQRVQFEATLLPNTDIAHELELLKTRVQEAPFDSRHPKSFLKPERATFSALQRELSHHKQRKERKNTFAFLLTTLPTCFIYICMYFALIPKQYYHANPLLYLVACGIILCLWLLWFLVIRGIYRRLFKEKFIPYMNKYPLHAQQATFAANSLYILVTMNPLFQAAFVAGKTITPSWSNFIANMLLLLIGIASGNFFTAVSNCLAIASALVVGLNRIQTKLKPQN